MSSYCVIADIAGNYLTLMTLIKKMPKGKILAVGDIIDRGPRSKEVIEYFMNNTQETESLIGNHEHMLLDTQLKYDLLYQPGIWLYNGGGATLKSFNNQIPTEVFSFLKNLKKSISLTLDNKIFYISHTFKTQWAQNDPLTFFWNRRQPEFNTDSSDFQIAGHNSQWKLRYFQSAYGSKKAISIDTSADKILTGIHLPSMNIYQQKYID